MNFRTVIKNTSFLIILSLTTTINAGHISIQRNQPNNKLNWVEVVKSQFSTQIMFDFAQPVLFTKSLNKKTFQLKLTFPGMSLKQFDREAVLNSLDRLKELGYAQNIKIHDDQKDSPQVAVTITFAQKRKIFTEDTEQSFTSDLRKNKLLIKWSKIDKPNRLILDIFTKEDLEKLQQFDRILYHVSSGAILSDGLPNLIPRKKFKDIKIVVDPGHGGRDEGARCFGLKEKDLSLAIARKVADQLRKRGFQALLTRSNDQELSLAERTELATQLKADLFVSVHINSAGSCDHPATGIETFHLSKKNLFPPARTGGFIFMNLPANKQLAQRIDQHTKKNLERSQKLAQEIQHGLMTHLTKKKVPAKNRGVKNESFRVLLQSGVPAALVEAGFITNKAEAKKLTNKNYQKEIAHGICQGIKKFITHHTS